MHDAIIAADTIGYPVAMKADVTNLVHKTDAGLVILNIRDEVGIRDAFQTITSNARTAWAIGDSFNGVTVQ